MNVERSGNLSVTKMKQEIAECLTLLEIGRIHDREAGRLMDGYRFLEMIQNPPYANCRTVSELKKKISEERQKIKYRLKKYDKYKVNYQLSIFEAYEEPPEEEVMKKRMECESLEREAHWLHKCLGMCSSRKYFR